MKRPSGRFPRRKYTPKRLPKRVLRVLTEGQRTEPRYFFAWRERYARVRLELADSGMTPDALVRRAREYAKKQPLKHADRDFDEIWCVFDTDEHENLKEALVEAEQGDINVALSNPCFELWLVLHAKEQTTFINRDDVQRQSDTLGLTDRKNIRDSAWETLRTAFEVAKGRARALDERHQGNGSPRGTNPSTNVWQLVDRLRNNPLESD